MSGRPVLPETTGTGGKCAAANPKEFLSLFTFGLDALYFVVFVAVLEPPSYGPRDVVPYNVLT